RRALQEKYNEEHGIIPTTIVRAIMNINPASGIIDYLNIPKYGPGTHGGNGASKTDVDLSDQIQAMRLEMFNAAESLEFEKAARLRDELKKLQALAGGASDNAGENFEPYGKPKKSATRMKKGPAQPKGAALAGTKSKRKWKS
ncbi:MAG: UvrB/UvrC motif-containing protein, partial [Polyangiaceae bacterium]